MALLRILRSFTFRLALIYLALFTVSVAVLLGLTYWAAVLAPLQQVEAALQAEVELLVRDDRDMQDRAGLVTQLKIRAATLSERLPFHALLAPDGSVIIANLPRWPVGDSDPWLRFEFETSEDGEEREYEVLARNLVLPDGARLLVGRDTEDLDEREELISQALLWGTGATLALGLAGGLLMSLAVAHRIEAVNRTARRVMVGELHRRVAVRGTGDDFDHLAETLNTMLDRIEELIESVSRVSDSVAHELRTPLMRLRTELEDLALEQQDAARRPELIDRALAEAARLQSIFDALLRIARIETGRHRASLAAVDLSAVLRDAAELYLPAAEGKRQRFGVDVEEGLTVCGDADLLFQAVSNLLDNAIKYTPAEGTVTLVARYADGSMEIVVADTGPGVPVEHRTRVLERFYRVPGEQESEGTGLGLALVAAVAQLHAATISLQDNHPGLRVVLRLSGAMFRPAESGQFGSDD